MDAESEIRRRIEARGRITFAEFMELALFWPSGGYYAGPNHIGAAGDYYTAPGAHPAFSALICLQVFQMWRLLGSPATFWLVELGAGRGVLCHDLVRYSHRLPHEFRDSLRYVCLELSPSAGMEDQLFPEDRSAIDRLVAQAVPLRGITGCFLSNEILDSFPVHQVKMDAGELREVYVTLKDNGFAEVLEVPSIPALAGRLDSLGVCLAEGSCAEINLGMRAWMGEVSGALERGFVLTIDYGHRASELYSDRRRRGTLTCFYRHTQSDDPYTRIGRQDMTAHVDFTSLIQEGRDRGLVPLGFSTQGEFLENLGLRKLIRRLPAMGLGQREADANRMGMLDIIRPGGLGDFKVLVQGKGVGGPSLWGYNPSPELSAMLEMLPVPLLGPHHTPLLEGRYPHQALDWESLLS